MSAWGSSSCSCYSTVVVLAMLAPHFGWRADTVLSGSMEPALPVGSIEVTQPAHTDDIR